MSKVVSRRAGITVLEVLFAAGIAVFGLVGIATLISVAGRQATQANELSHAQVLGMAWYSDFKVRGFDEGARWLRYNDLTRTYVPFVNSADILSGTSVNSQRSGNRHAICIDPHFFCDATTAAALPSFPTTSGQAYRPGLFPYYQDNFEPLSTPFPDPVRSLSPVFTSVDMPRLLRVSLRNQITDAGPMVTDLINRFFSSGDEAAQTASKDDATLPVARVDNGSRFSTRGEYSWFATLCPREFNAQEVNHMSGTAYKQAENEYTLSVVVTRRRDRQLFLPTDPGPENTPQGERLLNVSAPVNFVGGSGGRVTLSASINVSDKIKIGDWVMLARHQGVASLGRSVVVRWYRVIGVESEATVDLTTNTWSRDVTLDGPDWVFGGGPNATQATLVNGVVTVLERVVRLR